MTRPQYLALCIIGAVAVVAYLQSYTLARALRPEALKFPSRFTA